LWRKNPETPEALKNRSEFDKLWPSPYNTETMKANLFWEGIGMESGAELEKRAYDLMASGLN
jgi:hypothetical protein